MGLNPQSRDRGNASGLDPQTCRELLMYGKRFSAEGRRVIETHALVSPGLRLKPESHSLAHFQNDGFRIGRSDESAETCAFRQNSWKNHVPRSHQFAVESSSDVLRKHPDDVSRAQPCLLLPANLRSTRNHSSRARRLPVSESKFTPRIRMSAKRPRGGYCRIFRTN